jgi:WD40 repeat protein
VRVEQQINCSEQPGPWTGLSQNYAETFAARWKGQLDITKMGEYHFEVEADSGAKLWLNEKMLIEAPGQATLPLTSGLYRLQVVYFCKKADTKKVCVYYKGPDTENERCVLPVAVLLHDPEECALTGKPGLIAEYFPEDYAIAKAIPEGIEADIIRTEKQLDFDLQQEAWKGLPDRYGGAFVARYTGYIRVQGRTTDKGPKKAKYTFKIQSQQMARLFLDDKLLVQDDQPGEIDLSPGWHLMRVEYFARKGLQHELKLLYSGPETEKLVGDKMEPQDIIVPPTITKYYFLPTCATCKGDPLVKHEKPVKCVLWSRHDDVIASCGTGGYVCVWHPSTGQFINRLKVGGMTTAADMGCISSIVAVAIETVEGEGVVHTVELWDPTKKDVDPVRKYYPTIAEDAVSAKINAVCFNHDDTLIAACTEDGYLRIFDVASGDEKCAPAVSPKGEPIPLYTLSFSCDGTRLLTGGREKAIRIWDPIACDAMRGPEKVLPVPEEPEEGWEEGIPPEPEVIPGDPMFIEGHNAWVTCIEFAPQDPKRFASASTDATIRIWKLDEAGVAAVQLIDPIQCLSNYCCWSPDAATLVSSNEDTFVQLWSAVSGKPRTEPLSGHTATLNDTAWAPNGQAFVSCSDDNSLRLWHFLVNRNITEIAALEGEQGVFNDDMRKWQKILDLIRKEYTKYSLGLTEYEEKVMELRGCLDEGVVRTKSFNEREQLLGLEVTDYFELDGMIDDFDPYYKLWWTVINFQKSCIEWLTKPIKLINADQVETTIETWYKDSYKMIKNFDNDNMRNVQRVAKDLNSGIADFKVKFPFLRAFASEAILPDHWDQLFSRMGIPRMAEYDKISLQQMLDVDVLNCSEDFEELSAAAQKEYSLKKALAGMKLDWAPLEFGSTIYKDTGVALLRGIDEIQAVLDDHITKTQAIRSSPFCKPFEKEVHQWEATLLYIQMFIDQTTALQRAWMALEPIFLSDDIKKQLPNESEEFGRIDKMFRHRMQQVASNLNCLAIAKINRICEDMKEANETLERVQKGLKDYLETKRLYFPRFFFFERCGSTQHSRRDQGPHFSAATHGQGV